MTESYPHPARPGSAPSVALQAPDDGTVTSYDQRHFLTYARMLDAEAAGINWREGAAVILGLDVDGDTLTARQCWESHLARARWIATTGYRLLLVEAGLSQSE